MIDKVLKRIAVIGIVIITLDDDINVLIDGVIVVDFENIFFSIV